jgi:2-polyprenyl-3-methyl-5-hydroxy-6-metoxy-1,4-benzoquinol methylase
MFEFHKDRRVYFNMQVENTREYVLPFIEKYKPVTPGCRVLEIGCGEAGVLKPFIEKGATAIGVEFDESRVENAKEWLAEEVNSGKLSFLAKDIYDVDPVKELNGKFDIIILKDVIEHIHDQKKLIAWMKEFLNPGGVIFFGFPPWQMPFGGHQQIAKSKIISKVPYTHLLPSFLYRSILKGFKENVDELMEIKETGISIERFEKIVKETGYVVTGKTHYFINPIYKYKFKIKPRVQGKLLSKIRYVRNYFTTCVYYLITPGNN